jgi:hypothetical protein
LFEKDIKQTFLFYKVDVIATTTSNTRNITKQKKVFTCCLEIPNFSPLPYPEVRKTISVIRLFIKHSYNIILMPLANGSGQKKVEITLQIIKNQVMQAQLFSDSYGTTIKFKFYYCTYTIKGFFSCFLFLLPA